MKERDPVDDEAYTRAWVKLLHEWYSEFIKELKKKELYDAVKKREIE